MFGNEAKPVILGPNITGWFGAEGAPRDASGALSIMTYSSWSYGSYISSGHKVILDASKSNALYSGTDVQPRSLVLNYVIKY